jgi:hypothetical protein
MRRFTGFSATVAFIALVALVSAGVAWADDVVADGDGVAPVSTNALAIGNVCASSTTTKDVLIAITRQSSGTNVFKNSSTATFTVGTVTGTGLSAAVPAPGGTNTITIPSGWQAAANGTISPSVTSRVTFAAGAPGSTLNGSVSYTAAGINASNNAISRSSSLSVTATVVSCDTTPPTLNLPAAQTAEATSASGAVVTYTATATDANPASPTVSCAPASGSTFALATTTVSCSATDAAGNTANGSFTVTVQDTTAPVLASMPTNVTVEATSGSGAVVTYTSPTATDTVDGSRPVSCIPTSGSVLPLGANSITCSAADTRGNSSSSSFSVTVTDTTGPSLTLPSPIRLEATSPAGASTTFAATATDTVDGSRPVSCTPTSGSTFALGTTVVGCSASDTRGNATNGSFNVAVLDTTAPALTVPASFSVEATGSSGAAVTYAATANDIVDGAVTPSCNPASDSTFPLGATTVTCTATDSRGNSTSQSFIVTVVDSTPPVLSLPADVTFEADGPSGHVVTFAPSATDVVDGSIEVSCSSPSGAAFAVGITSVTCSATDGQGNTAQGQFTITITDTTAPTLALPDDITTEATGPDGATVGYAATADDIVSGAVVVVCDPASDTTLSLGATTVDCAASDAAGNEATGSFTVNVVDTTPPVIAGTPTDLQVEAESATGAEVTYTAPSATDIVDGSVTVTCTPPSGSSFPLDETSPVVCAASDNAGNSTTSSFTVLVSDRSAPLLTLPNDITEEATGPTGATVTFAPSATDVVDGDVPVTCDPASASTFALGTTEVGCSATDLHSNTAAGSFNVTVVDTTPPALTLPDPINAEATGPGGAAISFTATALDIVDGAVAVSCDQAPGSTFALGITTVTCSATDTRSNLSSDTFTVTVVDTTAPTLTLPADIVAEATGATGATVGYTASAADIVDGGVAPVCSPASGVFPLGTSTVTCTATDVAGNTASGTFTVTVRDTTAPALTVPADIVAEATGPAGAAVAYTATAADIVDGSVTPSCTPSSASTFALGTTAVSCSATDTAGNTSTGSFSVTVRDTTAPSISGTPTNVVQEATSASGAVVTYTAPGATDIVDGTVSVTCSPVSGSTFPLDATTTVTCTAVDAAGNTATSQFTVKVEDSSAPTLSLPAPITAEATGPSGASVPFAPSASDQVDGAVAVSCVPASGSLFGFGTTTVICSTQDAHGNSAGGSFNVTVVDTTAPTLTLPADITAEATGASGAVVTYTATATDIVDGALTPTCAPASGSTFAIGTTTVSCSVTDAHGNTSTGTFTVTVRDTTRPDVFVPASMSTTAISASGAPASYAPTAHDIVDGALPVVCSPVSGSTFAPGVHTVSCSATDSHGNTGTAQFTVTVSFDISGGLLQPVNPNALNTVKNGSTVPLKWQVRTPSGAYITSTSIVSAFVLTQVSCASLSTAIDEVDFTTTGGTTLRYDSTANQFIQNWQTPKKPGTCYRVDILFIGGQKLSACFKL